ncbi:tetratricopeptide repeat protein [Thermobifida halotolerans]|uniref:Tetratricopeptide repeat protein n=1 Tax=Thermobifida halotolerans TaxID=483545 RepID=A0AA97LZ51_9ACTN|nr:tetratricopeptide repeat protein [Thermobifida halotolerans]UOE20533.1 tetratricopeptide repeat protein [Thermobifida halotolerans]
MSRAEEVPAFQGGEDVKSETPASPAALGDTEAALLCDQARDLAEAGHLERAAARYERVVAQAGPRHRARAALGLAVVRERSGDTAAARRADETAIATEDTEFAPRAAYHLALLCEGEGDAEAAADAWRTVLALGNERYLAVAHHGLARLAESRGDRDAARGHWQRALDAPADPETVAEAARDHAERLLERGAVAEAAEAVSRGLAARETPALRVLLGALHVERAIAEFDAALSDGSGALDPDSAAVAHELLARLLAVRGDAETAERVWHGGLTHRDGEVAALVRARLRRGFLEPDPETAERTGEAESWWDPYLEAAVASDSAPLLAGELFVALSRMHALLAVRQADGAASATELRAALAGALRVGDDYVWGRALHDDLRGRLRRADGSA